MGLVFLCFVVVAGLLRLVIASRFLCLICGLAVYCLCLRCFDCGVLWFVFGCFAVGALC